MRTVQLTIVVRSILIAAAVLVLALAFVISDRVAKQQGIADVSNRAQSSAILLSMLAWTRVVTVVVQHWFSVCPSYLYNDFGTLFAYLLCFCVPTACV